MSGNAKIILAGIFLLGVCAASGTAVYFLMPSETQTVVAPSAAPAVTNTPSTAPSVAQSAPATPARAAAPPPANDAMVRSLTSTDETTRQDAIDQLHDLAGNDPHALGVGLPKWGPPLLAGGYFDDLQALAKTVIERRAMDISTLQAAQRLRVLGLIAQANAEKFPDQKPALWATALQEAKGYYNVAALSGTAGAANLLAEVLAQSTDAATATEFLRQQEGIEASGARSSGAASQPAEIFATIQGNTTQWDYDLQYLQSRVGAGGGASYSSLMCQGEYHLIDDQPDDARKCFEGACRVATSKASQVRNAMEGVARAIRDQNGSAAPANAFIESIRNDPGAAGAALIGTTADSPSRSDLKSAALIVKLADLTKLDRTPANAK